MPNKLPKSINLLEPLNTPEDIWDSVYYWLFNVGKYVLVLVEIVVLSVFFARFTVDRMNNDLTDEINNQVTTLSSKFYRDAEYTYRNLHLLFTDLNTIEEQQVINSSFVSSVIESIPSDVHLERFTFSDKKLSMSFTADDFEGIQTYESSLRNNPLYEGIRVGLSKSGESSAKIEFSVNFEIVVDELPVDLRPVTEDNFDNQVFE